ELPGYAEYVARLTAFARVILFDKRGSGLSDRRGGAPSLERRIEDLCAVMTAAGSRRAAILGISEGGPMACLFAATHPQRVSALVLYGTFARFLRAPDYPMMLDRPGLDRLVASTSARWGTGTSLDLFAPSLAGDPEARDRFARFERNAVSPSGLRELWRLVAELDVRDVLGSIAAPTMVCHRRDDAVVEVDAGRDLAARIPDAQFCELPGRDHLPFFGDDALPARVAEFITGSRHAARPATQRVLASVLFTDIVDSTATATRLGDESWRALLDEHDRRSRDLVEAAGGRVIKSTGDGILALFDAPGRAVRCGRALVEGLEAIGVAIRVGVHIGEVELRGDDVGGIAVHVAARVQAKAGRGEVWVSRTITDLVAGSGLRFSARGEHALKGVGTMALASLDAP
ncbi:MAG: alpha/beta fold hydrolase, partial [Myxococcales bacterium]|nr:alpha/beta fold hydrolase [Myxococcales bacterium]